MANRRGSSSGSITDDQLRRSALNKQKAKDKLSKKPGKSSDSVHCVCSSTEDVGHMVECESCCQWSHSKCVGLTFSTAPSYPFVCPFCVRSLFSRLSAIESEVADLSTRVSSLESTLNNQGQSLTKDIQAVTDSLRKVSRQVDPLLSNMPSKDAVGKSHTRTNPLGRSPVRNGSVSESRKGNVVLSGIPECPHGTPRLDRFVRDQDSAVSILSSVCSSITSQSIKDLFRLGKYSADRHRPLLVKFNKCWDASLVLSNKQRLASSPGISLRPDLSPTQMAIHSLLVKERRNLLSQGHNAKDIKIKESSLYLCGSLYGEVINGSFVCSPDTLAPNPSPPSDTSPSSHDSSTPPPASSSTIDSSTNNPSTRPPRSLSPAPSSSLSTSPSPLSDQNPPPFR